MAPLAQTLALLAVTMATADIDVKRLDMAQDSFDDQYQGCGPAMTAALPVLNCTEFYQNRVFAQIWVKAAAEWQSWGPPVTPLTPEQAIAIVAYTEGLYGIFNEAVHVAGRSSQQYRDKFHYKTLHFLLTDAMATLRNTLQGQCYDVFQEWCGTRFEAQRGDIVRFGHFTIMVPNKPTAECFGKETVYQVHTCHGVDISFYSSTSATEGVLIPPFETFKVTEVTRVGEKAEIQLHSTGIFSKYNCELVQGGSVPRAPFHLGGLFLATTALAVATGIL